MTSLRLGLNMVGGINWMGGVIYVRTLAMCLATLPREEQPAVSIVGAVSDIPEVRDLLAHDFITLGRQGFTADGTLVGRLAARIWRIFIRKVRGKGNDPWFPDVEAIYPVLAPAGLDGKEIFWIPDFQYEYLPHLFPAHELAERRRRAAHIAAQTGILVLSSLMARDDFHRLYPQARVQTRLLRFCSVLPGLGENAPAKRPVNLPEKYLYLPNQFWAHKDHATAFQAIRLLKERGLTVPLVCTGHENDPRKPDHVPGLKHFVAEHDLPVHFLGLVPRREQVEIFRHAAAVLQPSRFEGWSTVVEDAKAIGRPLILSDFPVHQEQAPEAKFYPQGDAEALAAIIEAEWPDLRPGPDYAAEAAAYTRTKERMVEQARTFMSIVTDAVALRREAR